MLVSNFIHDSLIPMEKQNTQILTSLTPYILENTPTRVVERYRALAAYAQEHQFGVLDEDVVVIDTETTGFSFNHDELIQIAAARMVHGEITDWYITFVNPGKPIPEDVAHLTNISDEDVASAPSADEALEALVAFVGSSDVVAHNANFDRTFCTKYPAGECLKENIWIDSLDLARIALPRLTSHRLLDLVRAFGGPDSTHRADDDVAATCLVYRVLLAAVATMPADLVQAIAGMATQDEWNTVYVFRCIADWQHEQAKCNTSVSVGESVSTEECLLSEEGNSADGGASARGNASTSTDEFAEAEKIKSPAHENPSAVHYNLRAARRSVVSRFIAPPRRDAFASVVQDAQASGAAVSNIASDTASAAAENSHDKEGDTLHFVDESCIAEAFSAEGLVGSLYDEYEPREEQKEMALAVHQALSHARNLTVEAGTGVGKSMAYLVPLVMAARENNITVGVATKTNALLDQLVHKELPLLADALGITYAPLKGFNHYPCLRKVDGLVKRGPQLVVHKKQAIHQAPALAGLLSFIDQSDYDDMDALKLDYRTIPRWRISTKSTECLRHKCPFFGRSCFVHGARDQAQRCDVVVTNHSLLFWDVRYDGGLLPPVRYWVVDEAHGAEAEARRTFSLSVSSESLQALARRVASDSASNNVLLRIQRSANAPEEARTLYEALITKARTRAGSFAQAVEEFCVSAKTLLSFDPKSRSKGYEYFDLWLNEEIRYRATYQGVAEHARILSDTLEKLIQAMRDIVAYAEQIEDTSSAQRELALVALELREVYDALDAIFFHENANHVYSVRMSRTKATLDEVFTVQPLDVGKDLNETLYATTNSVIYASATLSVDNRFDAFEQALGLNASEDSQADAIQVASSFDFDTNMRVFVPTDIPEPQDPAYLSALSQFLIEVHRAQGGSFLTLFTNRRDMERCFDTVHPAIKQDDLRLVCQKWGVSVKGLRDDFLKDETLSLFALKSFWEGFDAPGSTLKGVIVPKLPFGLPTDPLSCERQKRDDRAWAHYSLPAAVIEVKQAVGRLIRTATDHGVVILADKRLITKYYGSKFLNSLPSRTINFLSQADIVDEVRRIAESYESSESSGR